MRRLTRRVTCLCLTLISLIMTWLWLTVSAHPGPEHVHPCGADGRVAERSVHTTHCRPVRHGDALHTQTRSP